MPAILFVEDSENAHKYQQALEEQGYHVWHYANSDKAIRDIEAGLPYHLGIIDLSIPGFRGGDWVISASRRAYPATPLWTFSEFPFQFPGTSCKLPKTTSPDKLTEKVEQHFARFKGLALDN